jgi:phosphoglycerate dehydrogenase-like enzyme
VVGRPDERPDPAPPAGRPAIAVEPRSGRHEPLEAAVRAGGGEVVDIARAEGLVWADPARADRYPEVIARGPGVRWVQLPYAGIEPFLDHLDHERTWTCGKGVYAPPVAEHVLALALAGLRHVAGYSRARRWERPHGRNLLGARVTVLGGGEITAAFADLVAPFDVELTVVRRRPEPFPGAARTLTTDRLDEALPGADLVVLALALTPETTGIVDARRLALLEPHAWLVNVARGRHVVTDDLVAALRADALGGAALDVTDPEPLPEGHPLWSMPNVVITPHVGNTPEMGLPLLAARVTENVRRFAAGEPLLGLVDVDAGY